MNFDEKLKEYIHETDSYFVMKRKKTNCFEIFKKGVTCGSRIMQVGLSLGAEKAIFYCDRLQQNVGRYEDKYSMMIFCECPKCCEKHGNGIAKGESCS